MHAVRRRQGTKEKEEEGRGKKVPCVASSSSSLFVPWPSPDARNDLVWVWAGAAPPTSFSHPAEKI